MATIKLTVKSNFSDAQKDIKNIGKITEQEAKRIEKFTKSFEDSQIDSFIQKNQRAAAAVKATDGPLAAAQAKHAGLRREVQKLIRNGIDPESESMRKLRTEYDKSTRELEEHTKAQKQSSNIGIKSFTDLAAAGMVAINAFKTVMRVAGQLEDAYMEQQESVELLNSALRATGQFSDTTSGQMQAFASELQNLTTVGDEASMQLQQYAVSAGLSATEANQATKDAIGLSKAFGVELQAAIKATTNAQQGNYEMLNRYLPAVKNAETETEKAAIAQEQLANAFEVAKDQAETARGTQEQFNNVWGDTQEILGQVVAEGMTPLRKSFTGLLQQLNKTISQSRAMRDAIAAFKAEGAGVVESMNLDQLNEQIQLQNSRLNELTRNQVEGMGVNQELIRQTQDYIAALESQASELRVIAALEARSAGADKQSAELLKDKMKAQEANAEALQAIQELNQAALTSEQKKLKSLGDEIDKWATIRNEIRASGEDYSTVQALINNLAAQRNEILEAQAQKELENRRKIEQAWSDSTARMRSEIEEWRQTEIEAAVAEYEKYAEIINERDNKSLESYERTAQMARDAGVAEAEIQEWLTEKIIDYRAKQAQAAVDAAAEVMNVFSAVAQLRDAQAAAELQRMQENGATEEEIAQRKKELAREEAIRNRRLALFQVALDTASSIIGFLANPGGWAGIALSAMAATTGAIQAAAIKAQPLPSAESGGRFTVPDNPSSSRGDSVGMRVNPGEEVDVTPRGGGSGQRITVNNYLDRELLWSITQEGIDSGNISVSMDNVRAG